MNPLDYDITIDTWLIVSDSKHRVRSASLLMCDAEIVGGWVLFDAALVNS